MAVNAILIHVDMAAVEDEDSFLAAVAEAGHEHGLSLAARDVPEFLSRVDDLIVEGKAELEVVLTHMDALRSRNPALADRLTMYRHESFTRAVHLRAAE
jgi:hypothetical protein